jgi:hypothetical protein
MALEKVSRNLQIVIYSAVLCLVVIFFLYFYHQAQLTQADFGQLVIAPDQIKSSSVGGSTVNMNLNLLGTDKFLNLRSEIAPVQSFQSGKRNPFELPPSSAQN